MWPTPPARRPERFRGFGQPVFAPADGTVVSVGILQRGLPFTFEDLGVPHNQQPFVAAR